MATVRAPQYPPSQATLEAKALAFYRGQPARYRRLKADGELQEMIDLKVKSCRDEAASLMSDGVFETEAWNRAIRSRILESETD